MPKVTGPLFSGVASGNFAKTIQYVCGKFAKMVREPEDPKTEKQTTQRSKFTIGANKWRNELSINIKNNWKESAGIIKETKDCIREEFLITGYNLWMLYWLKFGEEGWLNYPNPPF